MTATVLRLLDQLGVLKDLLPFSRPMSSMTVVDDNLKSFGVVDFAELKDRYKRITWGKRVLSSVTEEDRVTLHCSDKSSVSADLVIGADG
ncbi:hypothetical protein DFQ26_002815, partial [Actinomortierella ambigua]